MEVCGSHVCTDRFASPQLGNEPGRPGTCEDVLRVPNVADNDQCPSRNWRGWNQLRAIRCPVDEFVTSGPLAGRNIVSETSATKLPAARSAAAALCTLTTAKGLPDGGGGYSAWSDVDCAERTATTTAAVTSPHTEAHAQNRPFVNRYSALATDCLHSPEVRTLQQLLQPEPL